MLNPREAFRIGFLLRCADESLAPAQARRRVKAAQELVKQASMWGETLQAAVPLASLGATAAITAPLAIGGLGGLLAHKAVEDDVSPDDVRVRELIAELKHWTRRAQEHKKHRKELQPA